MNHWAQGEVYKNRTLVISDGSKMRARKEASLPLRKEVIRSG